MKRQPTLLHFLVLLAFPLSGASASANPIKTLVVGDSQMVGPFGRRLNTALRRINELEVLLEGRVGSSPRSWSAGRVSRSRPFARGVDNRRPSHRYRGRSIRQLIRRFDPDVVLIELGGNMMSRRGSDSKKFTQRFVRQLQAGRPRPCFWVGPATVRANANRDRCGQVTELSGERLTLNEVSDQLPSWVEATCQYFESRPVTAYPSTCGRRDGDGLHFYSWTMPSTPDSPHFFREILENRPQFFESPREVNRRADRVHADEIAAYWAEKVTENFESWLSQLDLPPAPTQ